MRKSYRSLKGFRIPFFMKKKNKNFNLIVLKTDSKPKLLFMVKRLILTRLVMRGNLPI